jgi:hypothetical protein
MVEIIPKWKVDGIGITTLHPISGPFIMNRSNPKAGLR